MVFTPGSHPSACQGSRVEKSVWFSRLSINQTTTPRWSLREDLAHYAAAGAAGIGVNWLKLDDDAIPTDVECIRASELHVSSVGWCSGFTGAAGETFRDAVLDGKRKLRVAKQLSAGTLIVISGPQSSHIRTHAVRLLTDGLDELCGAASDAGVRLALQPMAPLYERHWTFLSSLDETLRILDRFPPEQAGLCFGAYHLGRTPGLLERLPEFASRIALVQLSDYRDPPRCENDRVLPGDGCIPLPEIVVALESAGYRGWYELEVWSRDLWKSGYSDLIDECVRRFGELRPPLVAPLIVPPPTGVRPPAGE